MPIKPSMDGDTETIDERERAIRIAWLTERVASGRYFVPAEIVARSLLRRLGLDLLDLQHQ